MFIADSANNRVRQLDLRTRVITTVGGTGDPSVLSMPSAVAVGSNGDLYVADVGNHQVLKLAA